MNPGKLRNPRTNPGNFMPCNLLILKETPENPENPEFFSRARAHLCA